MGRVRSQQNQRGAAAVEFALVLPVLLLVLFGAIEYGLVMYNQQVITNASREAARAGIVAGSPRVSDSAVTQVALDYCQNYLVTFDPANPPPTVAPPSHPAGQSFGDPLTVTVSYNYRFLLLPNLLGLFGGGGDGDLTLHATTTMRYE